MEQWEVGERGRKVEEEQSNRGVGGVETFSGLARNWVSAPHGPIKKAIPEQVRILHVRKEGPVVVLSNHGGGHALPPLTVWLLSR